MLRIETLQSKLDHYRSLVDIAKKEANEENEKMYSLVWAILSGINTKVGNEQDLNSFIKGVLLLLERLDESEKIIETVRKEVEEIQTLMNNA